MADAKKEIDEDIAKGQETDKENHPGSPKASSLATAVSNGKEKITDFFKRNPLGRGGGGISDATSGLTGSPTKISVNPIAATTTSVSGKSNSSPKTPPRVTNTAGNKVTFSAHSTTSKNSSPMTSSNDNFQMQTDKTTVNHNDSGYDNGINGSKLGNTGKAPPSSVNNDIFNSGLDSYNSSSTGSSTGTAVVTNDTDMSGNNLGISDTSSTKVHETIGVTTGNTTGNRDSNIPISTTHDITGIPNTSTISNSGNTEHPSTNHNTGSGATSSNTVAGNPVSTGVPSTSSDVTAHQGNPAPTGATSTGDNLPATPDSLLRPNDIIPVVPVQKIFATKHTTVVDFHIRHKGKATDFNLEEMFDGMVVAFEAVDPTIWFKSWNEQNDNKIWSKATIPTEEEQMKEFVEDPHTAPIGPYGRFYGRMTIVSEVEFTSFRRDTTFSSFLRNTGLFIERGDLACTRTRQVGFFNKKLPHDTRIPFFTMLLKQMIKFRQPFQIISQPLYEGKGSVLKCFVYVMIADPRHEKELLEDLAVLRTTDLEFHPWSAFRDSKQRTTKVGIINEMNTFAIGHSSILIQGLQENCMMRLFSTKIPGDEDMDSPEEFVDACTMDNDLFSEYEVDLNYRLQQLSCIEFMYSHFVDSNGIPIYVQINGPINGQFEVVFKNDNWDHARRIEKQYQATMIPFMTLASIKKAFTNGSRLCQSPPDSIHWRPPILITKVTPANTMNEVSTPPLSKKLQHVNFSFTKNATISYKSAALAGIRKVDIPTTTKLTTYDVPASRDVTPTLHQGNVVSTMSESEIQRRFQHYDTELISLKQNYDEEISLLKTQVAEIESLKIQVSEIAVLKSQVLELLHLKSEVSKLSQQNTDTVHLVETYTTDINNKYVATKKSITKLRKTTAERIESSTAELRESIKRRSRKETHNTNKTQNMLRLLLDERKISYIEEDDDELDDSDDEEYMDDQLEDPDDQYDSADEDFFDDDAELEDYDDTEPYISPHDHPDDESRRAASLSGLDKTNIIHPTSRTRSQSNKSQSQGVAGSQ